MMFRSPVSQSQCLHSAFGKTQLSWTSALTFTKWVKSLPCEFQWYVVTVNSTLAKIFQVHKPNSSDMSGTLKSEG